MNEKQLAATNAVLGNLIGTTMMYTLWPYFAIYGWINAPAILKKSKNV